MTPVARVRAISGLYGPLAALVRLPEMHPRAVVLTTDMAHFTIYRWDAYRSELGAESI